ncbi:MAG TPA: SIR2 family protein [Sedimentisphaerales bacterium]|jgi:hypothetical protein|nr:SIR2 family protein [Sedimentisphaerales bacterium]HNU29759.1 SIR2 family protein [Sedimentisphaerales bacterium]
MIDKHIVIVIGAGGSVPYGFLTGDRLKWAICDGLQGDGSSKTNGTLADLLNRSGFSRTEMNRLRDSLSQCAWFSIDEFLSQHTDLQPVGKAAIAGVLMKLENLAQLTDPKDEKGNRISNWYQLLFRTVFTPFEDIQKNNVTILTYNYDTSLETYLNTAMKASYPHKPDHIQEALKHVPIVHLHGKFVDHEYGEGIDGGITKKCAEDIHIVTENIDNNPEFKRAAQTIWEANEIYFIGFGYDPSNLKRLPIESKYPPTSSGSRMGMSRPSLNLFGTALGLAPAKRAQVEHYFKEKGFSIALGGPNEDAFAFLTSTQLFGVR